MKEVREKRKHPRVFIRALVDYESQDTFLYDYSKDLSQGGIFVQTDKPLKVGDVLELKFSLPDVEKVFQIKGEVRWTNSDGSRGLLKGMGIEFQNLKDDDKKLVQDYVSRVIKKGKRS